MLVLPFVPFNGRKDGMNGDVSISLSSDPVYYNVVNTCTHARVHKFTKERIGSGSLLPECNTTIVQVTFIPILCWMKTGVSVKN